MFQLASTVLSEEKSFYHLDRADITEDSGIWEAEKKLAKILMMKFAHFSS